MLTLKLINNLDVLHPLSKHYRAFLEEDKPFYYRKIRKGTLILLPGKDAGEIHFIGTGLFSLFRYGAMGEELLIDLFCDGSFMMFPVDFYDGPGNHTYFIKALAHSEIQSISREKMDKVCIQFPEANRHLNKIRNEIWMRMIERLMLLLQPKDDRFSAFVKVYNKVSPRLTKEQASRFLGTCKKTLNRGKGRHKGIN